MSVLEGAEEEFIRNLISAGIDVTRNGFTALHFAAGYGWLGPVKKLVETGAGLEIKDLHYGETALHFAVKGDHAAVVQYLLDKGANTWSVNNEGKTPVDICATEEINKIFLDDENKKWD